MASQLLVHLLELRGQKEIPVEPRSSQKEAKVAAGRRTTLSWAVPKLLSGGEAPGGPWLNCPDISTLRIRIGDERLMLASRSTSMEWVSNTSYLESSHFSEVGTKISGTTSVGVPSFHSL